MACGRCGKVAHGVRGATIAILGSDPVDRSVRLARQAACDACQHRQRVFCGKCRCVIAAKIRVASESCPAGKWPAVRSSGRKSRTPDSAGDTQT